MSALSDQAIVREGLWPLLEARRAHDLDGVRSMARALETADMLALGALADAIRREEVGDLVRIYANVRPEADALAVDVKRAGEGGASGLRFLRDVAIARITGHIGARVRVDWAEIGLELAQVALGFGASELVGPIANKRGLAIADDATKKVKGAGMVSVQAMKQRELAGLVERAGRRVVVVGPSGGPGDATARVEAT
jgi:2-iminoacetate synthase ThiH